jgi:hypothetical protein
MFVQFGEDTPTHLPCDPQAWLEIVAGNKPDKNQVYGLSIALVQELSAGHTISTIDTSHFRPSYISHEFDEIVHKRAKELLYVEIQNMRA